MPYYTINDPLKITNTMDVTGTTTINLLNVTNGIQINGTEVISSSGEIATSSTGSISLSLTAGSTSNCNINFGDTGDTNSGVIQYQNNDNSMRFYTNGTQQRMSIDSSGNVGIGDSTPSYTLDVQKTGDNAELRLLRTLGVDVRLKSQDDQGRLTFDGSTGNFEIDRDNVGTNVMTFLGSNGFVGIDSTNPQKKLEVNNSSGSDVGIRLGRGSNTNWDIEAINGGHFILTQANQTGSGEKMRIQYDTGYVGIGTNSPSSKLTVGTGTVQVVNAIDYNGFWISDSATCIEIGRNNSEGSGYLRLNNASNSNNGIYLQGNGYSFINGGNVGIGITNPSEALSVYGNIEILGLNDLLFRRVDGTSAATISSNNEGLTISESRGANTTSITIGEDSHDIQINNSSRLYVDSTSVGIGTDSPSELLTLGSTGDAALAFTSTDNNETSKIVASLNEYGAASQSIYFQIADGAGSSSEVMRIRGDGRVGINQTSPVSALHIKQYGEDSGGNLDNYNQAAITVERSGSTNKWSFGVNSYNDLVFWYNQADRGHLSNSTAVAQIDFTGQHRSLTINTDIIDNKNAYIGLIVSSTGNYVNDKVSIDESLPYIELSKINNDKKVYGVISDVEDINSDTREYKQGSFVSVIDKEEGDDRVIINSIGEGGIWVCEANGPFENGDYITTTELAPGYGIKQIDDLLHNYTVAKITQDEDFSDMTEGRILENGMKAKLVGCTYHCG